MRTVVCIVAHQGDQDLFDRHFGLWQRHNGWNIVVFTPVDAPVKADKKYLLTYPSEDGGRNHIRRWRQILSMLSTMEDVDRFVLFEPDSFCLSQWIPRFYVVGPDRVKRFDAPILVSNVKDGPQSNRKVSATHYVLHPIILTRSAIRLLSEAWRGLPDDFEGGHSDRAIFRLAQQSGVRIADFQRYGLGYGDIRIFETEYPALMNAVTKGATMIHGVKEKELTDSVRSERRLAVINGGDLSEHKELPVVDDLTACWIPGKYFGYLLKDLDSEFEAWFNSRRDLQEQYPELLWGLRKL